MRLTFLTRAYCHLCDEMRDVLAGIAEEAGCEVVEIDVDGAPHLETTHGERVPVLLLGGEDGEELCHYRLDAVRVRRALGLAA